MRILIIRHGDPDYSIDSLTDQGRIEADLLAKKLVNEKIDYIYCSTLGRAKDTAEPTLKAKNMSAEYCEWLREVNYMQVKNPDDKSSTKQIWDFKPRFFANQDELHTQENWLSADIIKSSECDIAALYNTVTTELDKVLAKHGYVRNGRIYDVKCGSHDTIAFFCHFGTESILLSHLLNLPPLVLLQNTMAAPTSVTTIYTEEREKGVASLRCQSFGDVSHLYVGNVLPAFSGRFCECFEDDERH